MGTVVFIASTAVCHLFLVFTFPLLVGWVPLNYIYYPTCSNRTSCPASVWLPYSLSIQWSIVNCIHRKVQSHPNTYCYVVPWKGKDKPKVFIRTIISGRDVFVFFLLLRSMQRSTSLWVDPRSTSTISFLFSVLYSKHILPCALSRLN